MCASRSPYIITSFIWNLDNDFEKAKSKFNCATPKRLGLEFNEQLALKITQETTQKAGGNKLMIA